MGCNVMAIDAWCCCVQEKQNYIPEDLGRDAQSVAALQRKHANFEHDLITLGTQVSQSFTFFEILSSLCDEYIIFNFLCWC